ncbi:MAG: CBS domain-containing protein [Methanosarcinales archaeon]|jgi:predicted transcriptional regulator|nr:CBS domain-containing protein [Methanosarcinales archaeon]
MQLPTPEDLKKKRIELGLTQSDLAKRAGVSQPLIARIEMSDVDPRLSTVAKILTAFDEVKKEQQIVAKDIISSPVIHVQPKQLLEEAVQIMNSKGISQLPVIENGVPVGSLSEGVVVRTIAVRKSLAGITVSDLMEESFPTVPQTASVLTVSHILERSPAVLVMEKGIVTGVITKSDIMKIVNG